MQQQIIISGFGGQGVMLIGQFLAYGGMFEDKEVSWLPSYGPEMRGGTANCCVIVSDDPVASPIVTKPDTVIAMNLPSLLKFEEKIVPGGNLFINASLIDQKATRDDINVYYIDTNTLAEQAGSQKVANVVMLGAVVRALGIVKMETIEDVMHKKLTGKKEKFIPLNLAALQKGSECVEK